MIAATVKSLPAGTFCTINGHECVIVRQARKTTFVRIVEGELSEHPEAIQISRNVRATYDPARPRRERGGRCV